ncbi:MAG: hypothetical protein M5R36_04235 [Deltaproteobacteria bacterium]|nr:hypothetical protein [Deltaproteobacteria bacterium]
MRYPASGEMDRACAEPGAVQKIEPGRALPAGEKRAVFEVQSVKSVTDVIERRWNEAKDEGRDPSETLF